jgi:hypothetical protein
VREFLNHASALTSDDASRADAAAMRTGFVTGRDLVLATAMIVNAGRDLKLNDERSKAQAAGQNAIVGCAGARGCSPVLSYAAGMMAEALVVRDALDPKSWEFVTAPWRTVVEIPPQYEGDEPEAVAMARAARADASDFLSYAARP